MIIYIQTNSVALVQAPFKQNSRQYNPQCKNSEG